MYLLTYCSSSLVLKYFTALSSSLLINVSKSVELRFSHEGEIFNFKENHRFIVECMICSNIHVTIHVYLRRVCLQTSPLK